jgi:F-type H+-transporting ATPase subunit b
VLIDWFTVIAQIINFLILVLLLRRFLYQPILNAMAERERKIAERLSQAEGERETAVAEIETYRQKNSAFDQEREQRLRDAQADVDERRQAWLKEARAEIDETRTRWHNALAEEKEAYLQMARQQVGQQSTNIIRRALSDLADAELEAHILQVFLARLAEMPSDELQVFHEALRQDGAVLTLKSAFKLDKTQWQALRQAVFAQFGVGQPIQVQNTPDLICGLELVVPGHKLAWSVASYLDALEEALDSALLQVAAPDEVAREVEPDG